MLDSSPFEWSAYAALRWDCWMIYGAVRLAEQIGVASEVHGAKTPHLPLADGQPV